MNMLSWFENRRIRHCNCSANKLADCFSKLDFPVFTTSLPHYLELICQNEKDWATQSLYKAHKWHSPMNQASVPHSGLPLMPEDQIVKFTFISSSSCCFKSLGWSGLGSIFGLVYLV